MSNHRQRLRRILKRFQNKYEQKKMIRFENIEHTSVPTQFIRRHSDTLSTRGTTNDDSADSDASTAMGFNEICKSGHKQQQETKNPSVDKLTEFLSSFLNFAHGLDAKRRILAEKQQELERYSNIDWLEPPISAFFNRPPEMDIDRLSRKLEVLKSECVYLMNEIRIDEKNEKKMILKAKKAFVDIQGLH
ncbi:hypothetical protein ACO0RG_001276 [Hanseniaspora osmophila]|uniref:Uncharacterized protein n=1 Tax=Hanseniaspora osmophila TaxID=56408 RepID=A0A1E5RNJ4_9ASCO|nr:hypothetical protein AWRI3579_g909 [Hanseniaspora osmophila]